MLEIGFAVERRMTSIVGAAPSLASVNHHPLRAKPRNVPLSTSSRATSS